MAFSPKTPAEVITLHFDFGALTADLLSSALNITVSSGIDSDPNALLVGMPAISGASVLQTIQGGIDGVTYRFDVTGTNSLGDTFEITELLLVTTALAGAALDELFPYIQPEITSCPNSLVRSAILRAAIEFCEKSLAYKVIKPLTMVNNIKTYSIPLPYQTRLISIENMWGTSRELTSRTFEQLQTALPNWKDAVGMPYYYNQPNVNEVVVYPMPSNQSVPELLSIRLILAPVISATQLSAELVNVHIEAIAAKAKSILMLMPNQPWSDQNTGGLYRIDFLGYVDKARIEAMHVKAQGSLSVRPRKFGG